jgi:multidrug efflux pump subunit AcrB
MTVAVGRVVDDSIVVLENIYRHIQRGKDPRQAVIDGTRDVAIPIFASTVTTVVVFLPIGLMGGMIGGFFLPFGMTVTYALASSFIVAITIVPVLAYLFIRKEHLPAEKESRLQRAYTPLLKWALRRRAWTMALAAVAFVGSLWLMSGRPRAFIPDMGEASLNVSVGLPNGITMAETDGLAMELEGYLATLEGVDVYQTEIGSAGGMEAAMFAAAVDQGSASLTISVDSADDLEVLMPHVRAKAESIFGAGHVTVSAGGLMGGSMSSFDLVLAGDPDVLADIDGEVIAALEAVDGLENVTSNLSAGGAIVRIDGKPAVQYAGEMESENTMGLIEAGKAAVEEMEGLPAGVTVSGGFMSDMQTEGFAQASQALLISIIVVYLVMVATFGSLAHPFVILFSLPLAVVGAALGLWITDRVVGISAMVGLMMLVGIVVTNAIILIDRVRINRKERAMGIYDALIEAGRTRLRPILMTAIAAILALVPLALGLTEGALIASELATVVIGGLMVSTLLTLLVVPVVYSLVESALRRLRRA